MDKMNKSQEAVQICLTQNLYTYFFCDMCAYYEYYWQICLGLFGYLKVQKIHSGVNLYTCVTIIEKKENKPLFCVLSLPAPFWN